MNGHLRPRRSMLYVPGCNTHYLDRARTLATDAVILDLGDPILIDAKLQSRLNVVDAVKQGGYGGREVVVRVNDLDSEWGHDDIKAVANIGADAILFPNIESKEDVLVAKELLDKAGGNNMPIMVMIESPLAVLNAKEIASASDRIICMVIATSDLITQLHARYTPERTAILTSLSLVVLAARAYKVGVIDGIASDLKNMQAFEYACRLGRDLGFDGKSIIHPAQIAYSNDAYTPKASEIANAREVIKALKKAQSLGKGTVIVNDKFVESHHIAAAERIIQLSEMIEELEEEFI